MPPQKTKAHMQNLPREITPIIANIPQSPLKFSSATHFLTNARCKASANMRPIRSIRLNYTFPLKTSPGPYGKGALLPVSIDDNACASMHMYRFSEAESEMVASEAGRVSLALAKRVVDFLEKNAPPHKYETGAQNRFASLFPAFEGSLRNIRFKSRLFVARLNVSGCSGMTNKGRLDLVFVKKPVSFFYCNMFADKDLSMSHPCFQHTVKKKWVHAAAKEEMETERPETTVFLSGAGLGKSCMYSSSESVASDFRDAFYEVPSSPEPSPEGSMEPLPESSESPTEPETEADPITVPDEPKRGKACFPSHALVTLRNGRRMEMRHLRIGDEVEVAPAQFSPVILFSHATDAIESEMVTITTLSGAIAASTTHLLREPGGYKAAGLVRPGDALWVLRNGTLVLETVRSVLRNSMRGLYNPHTKSGTILVSVGDGASVLASPFTTAVSPAVAHAALTPLRWAHFQFGITIPVLSTIFPDTRIAGTSEAHSVAWTRTSGGRMRLAPMTELSLRTQQTSALTMLSLAK